MIKKAGKVKGKSLNLQFLESNTVFYHVFTREAALIEYRWCSLSMRFMIW